MKAYIKEGFTTYFVDKTEDEDLRISDIDDDSIEGFDIGDKVDILKVIDTDEYEGGKAYVVYNPKNHGVATVFGGKLDFID